MCSITVAHAQFDAIKSGRTGAKSSLTRYPIPNCPVNLTGVLHEGKRIPFGGTIDHHKNIRIIRAMMSLCKIAKLRLKREAEQPYQDDNTKNGHTNHQEYL